MENFKNLKGEPLVSIIILNWNGWQDTIECLESVYQIDYTNYNVVVVDNASTDHSVEEIRKYCEGRIKLEYNFFYKNNNKSLKGCISNEKFYSSQGIVFIKNDKNYGFAEGNNIAIRYALKNLKSEYILLLNNDTIVDPNFLTQLVNTAKRNGKIGFVGPKIYYYDFKGSSNVIGFAGGILNKTKCQPNVIGKNNVDSGQFNHSQKVDYVEGSCILVKRELIEKVGCFDSDYFTYWEEIDWCIRGFKAGYNSFYDPNAKIWHKTGASNIGTNSIYYMIRNRFLFMKKNNSKLNIVIALIYFFGYYFWIIFTSFLLIHRNFKKCFALIKGSFDGLKILFKDL